MVASLTHHEAVERSALVTVRHYDIAVDMTGLLEGPQWRATSTIRFACRTPGAATFVDCAADIDAATLNGRPIDLTSVADGRVPLSDLAAENELVISSRQDDTGSSRGILRTVDPADGRVYVWTSLEAAEAHRLWACFDQPDLKAPHRFTVTAPASWLVTSNRPPDRVEEVGEDRRTWWFPDTPPLSTYVVVVNGGPFHEIRSRRDGWDLGLYCRQSMRPYLERDAEHFFDTTTRGLAFFGEQFGSPFPQERYDHVFVPNMGGAMENWGCVTWGDYVLYRSEPSPAQREYGADVLLHEMAHMWFGDLVTMRWWDDLWLNEAFASWASTWASTHATPYVDAWATFQAVFKLDAYRVDMGPGSHPIRAEVPDTAHALANFDQITYLKGQSVLRQLVAYVGEDGFLAGLRDYFRDHAYGNTRLDDLISAIADASGVELDGWVDAWLDAAGTDTIRLTDTAVEITGPDDGPTPRPHRFDIGCFRESEAGLARVAAVPVVSSGGAMPLPDLPAADVLLPNDGDLTYAAIRPADPSRLFELADRLPDPLARSLAVGCAWDMLAKGEIDAASVRECLLAVLGRETAAAVIEPMLALAVKLVESWTPRPDVAAARQELADRAAQIATDRAQPAEVQLAALRTVAVTGSTAAQLDLVAARDDVDLAWRLLARRAELGDYDEAGVRVLLARDPDPDAEIRALGVRAARPDPEGKEEAWQAVFTDRRVPAGPATTQLAFWLWRADQAELLRPFTFRYLDELTRLGPGAMLATLSLTRSLFPQSVADRGFLDEAQRLLATGTLAPVARSTLVTGCDTLRRQLRSRS